MLVQAKILNPRIKKTTKSTRKLPLEIT